MRDTSHRDLASMAACVVFIVVAALAFVTAADFSPLGAVFPRTISALMIFFAAMYLGLAWIKHAAPVRREAGSRGRQAAVAVIMLGWAFVLEPVGFLVSSVVAFALLLVVAHYDRWTARVAVSYAIASALMIGCLYGLFKVVLQVPLPQGMFL